jgi:hypothetical protein
MTRVIGVFLLVLLLAPWPARAGDLTLRDVVELHRSGLGEDLLVAVIEADGGPFELGYADIMDLKSDGLSERIITALVRTGSRRSQASTGDAPAVQVEQHVTNVVPGGFVTGYPVYLPLGAVDDSRRQDGRRHGGDGHRDARRGKYQHKVEVPPATWITRQEDGRTIAPVTRSGVDKRDRHDKPPAAWVTPNPIRTERREESAPPPH